MKKRVWSFIMAIVMILTMVPVQAKAVVAQANAPQLMLSWTDWNSGVPSYNPNYGIQDYFSNYMVLLDGGLMKKKQTMLK